MSVAQKIPKPSFLSRYLVTIVMIPSIIGMHYGWMLLQDNKALVPEEDKIELPVVMAAKHLWKKIQGTVAENEPVSK